MGVEVIKNKDNIECIRLIIWPGEISKTQILQLWDHIEYEIKDYFNDKKELPWTLKIRNFWRDTEWYNLKLLDTHCNNQPEKVISLFEHDDLYKKNRLRIHNHFEKKEDENTIIRKIMKYRKERMPITFDRLFVEHLINREKGTDGAKEPLLDEIDPETVLAGNKKYDTLNKFLYHIGIFKIATTKIEWGRKFSI